MLRRFPKWVCNWRIIRRCLYGFACFASLILLFYAEEDWRGKRDWEQYKSTWEAKGERFNFASFVPPAVPDDQNFALTPIVASTYSEFLDPHGHRINPPNTNVVNQLDFSLDIPDEGNSFCNHIFQGNWQLGIKADLKFFQTYYRAPINTNRHPRYWVYGGWVDANLPPNATNGFPTTPQPQSPAADVLLALSKEAEAIEELRQAARLPYSRFPLNYYANPFIASQSDLSPLFQCAQVLRLRAIAELENEQNERAADDVKLILYMANAVRDQSFLTSHVISFIDFALQPLWEGLVNRKWSDAQLAVFEQELAKFDILSDYQFAVRSKRAWAINDQPLHYRRTDDGQFLLYSVGWNGTDDGGIVVRQKHPLDAWLDMEKGDWVWPCSSGAVPSSLPHRPRTHPKARQ